jgi:hypothetical protein
MSTNAVQPINAKPISVPAPRPKVLEPHRVIKKTITQTTAIAIASIGYNGDQAITDLHR